MEALANIPQWLFAALFAVCFLAAIWMVASRNTKRQIRRTLERRANPTRQEFMQLMAMNVSKEASEFLWEQSLPELNYFNQEIAPHPDDHLIDDLPIDEEGWSMEWPILWAERRGFHESNLPDWPEEWPVTVRNFGRWLDMGPE